MYFTPFPFSSSAEIAIHLAEGIQQLPYDFLVRLLNLYPKEINESKVKWLLGVYLPT